METHHIELTTIDEDHSRISQTQSIQLKQGETLIQGQQLLSLDDVIIIVDN